MEIHSEQRLPSDSEEQSSNSRSKKSSSPVPTDPSLLPPPPPSSHLTFDLNDDDTTPSQQQHYDQQQPSSSSRTSKKTSDSSTPRRLSFMSFMSFVSGKSNRSSSGISQTDHDRYDKPRSAQGLEQQQHAQTTTTTTTTSTGTPFSFGGHEAPPHVQVPPHPPGSYPRSLDTPGLDPESEDEDNLGALPAFGISERGYLASLVSLFGGHPPGVNGGSGSGSGSGSGGGDVLDTNSSASHSPLSALTAITAPSVLEDGIGIVGNLGRPYEYDVHSPAVYAYAKVKDKENERLFVGLPGIVHPPPEALLEFELETLPLLERDLHELAGQFGQRGIRITYELRMSGLASNNLYGAAFKGETVILSPTVWILYRSYSSMVGLPSCQLELEHAVSKLHYLQHRPVEVQEGGGRIELAGDRRLVDVKVNEEDCIHLSGGGALSVHIEDIASVSSKDTTNGFSSVCGALCSITIEEEDTKRSNQTYQSLCRIGGLLLVNGKYILGVSTAHAMLDSSNIFKDSFDNASEPRSLLGKAVDRDIIIAEAGNTETITTKWADVTRDAAVDFLGVSMNSRGEMAINRSNPENATDFALLRLRQTPPGELRNQYTPPGAEKPVMITSSASASAASLDEGPVYILCRSSGDKIVDGQLVWGSACFVVRGRNFHLRRIQTSRPLNASAAGSWVVRGEVLYGVIVAVYEDEPFALMMTAERLFSSILGSAFSIRSVELWDGVLPEAYRIHEEERQKKAKEKARARANSKDRVKVEVRPLSNGSSTYTGATSRKGGGGKQGGSSIAGSSSLKNTPRLNTVVERVETESEAGPSSSSRVGSVHYAAAMMDDGEMIASPRSYGLPHIEASTGLGIDEGGGGGVASTGENSFVTASEGTTSTDKDKPPTASSNSRMPGIGRTVSQASNVTMSGAVPWDAEKKDETVGKIEDIDIEDWHIKDWIPNEDDNNNDDGQGASKNAEGHFDLKTGPPIPHAHALVQVAEVSSIMTGREQELPHHEEQPPLPVVEQSTSIPQVGVEPSVTNTNSRGPSPLPFKDKDIKQPEKMQDGGNSGSGGGSGPRLKLGAAFFLRRRDSAKSKHSSGGDSPSSTVGPRLSDAGSNEAASITSREGKRSSFLGRFARRNTAEKESGRKSRLRMAD